MSETPSSDAASKPFFGGHGGKVLVLGLILALIWLQGPMVRGWYYRLAGSPAPADGIAWRTNLSASLAEAKTQGRPVLVDFTATWCPPCQVMAHEVWPSDRIAAIANGSFIPVKIDIDADPVAADQFNIVSVPAVLILNADGDVLAKTGYESRREMLDFLATAAKAAEPSETEPPTPAPATMP